MTGGTDQFNHFTEASPERLVSGQDVVRTAGTDWRDGLVLGNGDVGAVAYAPGHLEWCVNKVDVYDATVPAATLLTHERVVADCAIGIIVNHCRERCVVQGNGGYDEDV